MTTYRVVLRRRNPASRDTYFRVVGGVVDDKALERDGLKLRSEGGGVYTTHVTDTERHALAWIPILLRDGFLHGDEAAILEIDAEASANDGVPLEEEADTWATDLGNVPKTFVLKSDKRTIPGNAVWVYKVVDLRRIKPAPDINPPRPPIRIVRPITRSLAIDMIGQQDIRGRRKKKHTEPGWYMDMVPAGHLFLVEVPVSALWGYDDRPEITGHYARRTTPFPPITVHPVLHDGRPVLNVWQGNHRAMAAQRRGDKTIRAIMSQTGIDRWRRG